MEELTVHPFFNKNKGKKKAINAVIKGFETYEQEILKIVNELKKSTPKIKPERALQQAKEIHKNRLNLKSDEKYKKMRYQNMLQELLRSKRKRQLSVKNQVEKYHQSIL